MKIKSAHCEIICATSHPVVRVYSTCYREDVGQKMFSQQGHHSLVPEKLLHWRIGWRIKGAWEKIFFGNTSGGIRAALLRWGSWPNVAD